MLRYFSDSKQQLLRRYFRGRTALKTGDRLNIKLFQARYYLSDSHQQIVGRMARSFKPELANAEGRVVGIIVRFRRDSESDPVFRGQIKCDRWEVVVPEFQEDHAPRVRPT